jgi:choline dehydrogenase-like flavoprotein
MGVFGHCHVTRPWNHGGRQVRNLLVCDGAAMPANPGVNPSLTITAITEHSMSHILPAAAPA